MKNEVQDLVNDSIKDFNMFVEDAFLSKEEGNVIFNIVLDSDTVIDVERITEASKVINEIMDQTDLIKDADVLDIYSKMKGDDCDEQ